MGMTDVSSRMETIPTALQITNHGPSQVFTQYSFLFKVRTDVTALYNFDVWDLVKHGINQLYTKLQILICIMKFWVTFIEI